MDRLKTPAKTVVNGATTVQVHPEYTGCEAFGVTATVTTTGCDYLFHPGSRRRRQNGRRLHGRQTIYGRSEAALRHRTNYIKKKEAIATNPA
jgi:hypothetical protein